MIKVMRTPRTVDLELTSRCNLRCKYCYYMNNEGVDYHDLPTQRWLDFFDELGRASVMSVCLSGGEALMRPDLFELIDGVVRNRMRFELLSNGRLVTREVAQRLKATGRCKQIQISLDGSCAEVHESMRGKGSFAPALNAIKLLHEEGLPLTVRTTVHARNVDDLPAVARLLLEEIGLPGFSTNAISSLGTNAKYGDALFLSPAQRLCAMHVLAGLDEKYEGRIEASAGPLAEWHMFHAMEAQRRDHDQMNRRGHLMGCGCIFSRVAVRADGGYIPCVMLPQTVLGYIGEDKLEDVWQKSVEFNALRQRITISLDTFERCHACDYKDYCTGNCAGNAYSVHGDANYPGDDGCLKLFQQQLAQEGLSLW